MADDQPARPSSRDWRTARLTALEARVGDLEAQLEAASHEVRTRRLTVCDGEGRPRLVAEVVDDVTELRIDLPGSVPGARTAVLVFGAATHAEEGLGAGVGVQLWVEGNLIDELAWWG